MYAAIRVRGKVNVSPRIKKTLELLRLGRVNHLALVKKEQKGMLEKAQSFITFGEINEETLALAVEKRGRLPGNKKISKDFLEDKKIASFEELAKSIIEEKTRFEDVGIKPILRLSPPKKGYERAGIKKSYSVGGALGYRASDINKLVKRMI